MPAITKKKFEPLTPQVLVEEAKQYDGADLIVAIMKRTGKSYNTVERFIHNQRIKTRNVDLEMQAYAFGLMVGEDVRRYEGVGDNFDQAFQEASQKIAGMTPQQASYYLKTMQGRDKMNPDRWKQLLDQYLAGLAKGAEKKGELEKTVVPPHPNRDEPSTATMEAKDKDDAQAESQDRTFQEILAAAERGEITSEGIRGKKKKFIYARKPAVIDGTDFSRHTKFPGPKESAGPGEDVQELHDRAEAKGPKKSPEKAPEPDEIQQHADWLEPWKKKGSKSGAVLDGVDYSRKSYRCTEKIRKLARKLKRKEDVSNPEGLAAWIVKHKKKE